MTIDVSKAFEVENGLVLNNAQPFFSDSGTPVGVVNAPTRSFYYDSSTGDAWFKFGAGVNDWRKVRPEFFFQANNLFRQQKGPLVFNSANYERLGLTYSIGSAALPGPVTCLFQVLAFRTSGNSVDLRLYDSTNLTQLAALNFTETTATFKEVAFTCPTTPHILEIQGKRNGNGNGSLMWAAAQVQRSQL